MSKPNVAVEVAKEIAAEPGSETIVTKSGVRIRLLPVSASLIEEVTRRIVDPEVPQWYNEQRERNEPNPDDPAYIKALEETARKRGVAVMDAMCMFGVELVDGVPADDSWVKKLRFMEKRGQLDLSEFDLDDELDREFVYKRFIATDQGMINKIGSISSVTSNDVSRAEETFRGN